MTLSTTTFESYVETLRRSGLLKSQLLDQLVADFEQQPTGKPEDCEPLVKRLLSENILTDWQHGHILAGRNRGFFLGNYKLLKMLGAGGMGAVYLAEHTFMQRRVAVKVLFEAQVDQVGLERFHLECRTIAALDHPNIIRAHDFDSDGEFLYLVMEYIEGPDLHALVQQREMLPFVEAANYIRQAAEGLAHAHGKGMIHRDIKPANLLVDPKGVLKILDLGLARITNRNRDEKSITTAGAAEAILGTVDFLAPEQAVDCHNVDYRADIYSLGCTFYYLMTGHAPFPEGNVPQRLMRHQLEDPPSISLERPDVPEELAELCMKMMAKSLEDRVQTAAQVAEQIRRWEVKVGANIPTEGSASDTSINGNQPTTTVKKEQKVHLRCDRCRTVYRPSVEKAERVKVCPKCHGPLVRAETD